MGKKKTTYFPKKCKPWSSRKWSRNLVNWDQKGTKQRNKNDVGRSFQDPVGLRVNVTAVGIHTVNSIFWICGEILIILGNNEKKK